MLFKREEGKKRLKMKKKEEKEVENASDRSCNGQKVQAVSSKASLKQFNKQTINTPAN